jgi:hypothetical protein
MGNSSDQNRIVNALRYTFYTWVLYLLPLLSGLTLLYVGQWSVFWLVIFICITLYTLINNLIVVWYRLYGRPMSKAALILQVYFACFFGVMILGKIYPTWWMYLALIVIFLINGLLGVIHRRSIYNCGWISFSILCITCLFPAVFALLIHMDDFSLSLGAAGLISSIAAGVTYYSGRFWIHIG